MVWCRVLVVWLFPALVVLVVTTEFVLFVMVPKFRNFVWCGMWLAGFLGCVVCLVLFMVLGGFGVFGGLGCWLFGFLVVIMIVLWWFIVGFLGLGVPCVCWCGAVS